MAISGGDGSIILATKIDTKGVDNGVNKIKQATQKLKNALKGTSTQISKSLYSGKSVERLQKDLAKTTQSIEQTKAKIAELYRDLDKLQANAFKAPETGEPVFIKSEQKQFDKLNSQLNQLEEQLMEDKTKAEELGLALEDATKKTVPGVAAATKGIEKFGKRIAGLVKRVFVFFVILRALRALLQVIKDVAMGDAEFRDSLYQLQAALWTAFTPVLNVIVPALKSLVNWLTQAAVAVGKFFAVISGRSYASMVENAKGLKQQTDGYKQLGESAEEAQKQLAGFDEIQILSSEKDSGGGATTAGNANFEAVQQTGTEDEVNTMLTTIIGVVGGALVALGVLLLWNGQLSWGIGFIIAGAAAFGVSAVSVGSSDLDFSQQFSSIMTMAGGALLALGLVLFFKTQDGLAHSIGLGMIVAGAGVLAIGAIQVAANEIGGEVGTILHGIITVVSGFVLAVGIILLCFGQITPLSIGLVVAGAAGLASEIALYPDKVKEALQGWVGGVLAIVSTALLVLGIVLCVVGVVTPLSIGMIVVGAVGLVAVVALNWNYIKDKVVEIFNSVWNWIKTWGLLVLGIILTISGVAMPLGIALLALGAQNLTMAQDPLWTSIVDKVKEIWGKIKEFWDRNIAPIFTAQWWEDLGKRALNGLIGIVEKALNFLIDKINVFVSGISSVVSAVGGLFGADWNIPKIPEVSIPRLAQGAVIPPNREFLAVLGDQKRGVNIEAPLQTIVDAFNIALAQNGGARNGNTEVVLEIDGREFGRAVVEQGNRENRRIGTRLVIA